MLKGAGSKVAKLKLTPSRAQARIRQLAQVSENVILTDHAAQRMGERGILSRDVFRILRTGYVDDLPDEVGSCDWKCKITEKIGERIAGVVTIVMHRGKLVVKTVEWEDRK